METPVKKRMRDGDRETRYLSPGSPQAEARQHATAGGLDISACSVEDLLATIEPVQDYQKLDDIAEKLSAAATRLQDVANMRFAQTLTDHAPTPESIHTVIATALEH